MCVMLCDRCVFTTYQHQGRQHWNHDFAIVYSPVFWYLEPLHCKKLLINCVVLRDLCVFTTYQHRGRQHWNHEFAIVFFPSLLTYGTCRWGENCWTQDHGGHVPQSFLLIVQSRDVRTRTQSFKARFQ